MTDSSPAEPQPMAVTIPDHLFGKLPFYDVVDTDDMVVVDLHNRPDLTNIRGALQGGLVATLIDIAAGRLAVKYAGHLAGAATSDMTIHFLAPIMTGPARATATLVRAGRRSIVVAVDVIDVGADRHAARATVSFAVLEPR
ncbi:phenylacetic acid degradation protein [Mycolicibacterium hassiacum DSM 44199]|nr:phenylacetic acid degradation protein [Mycolicibacterium hassiacum DSM 44199]